MKITFLGTGAAEGVPAAFCGCEVCKRVRALGKGEWRSRSQVLVDEKLCVDFPPDAFYHSMAFNVDLSAIETLVITHSHMDHFYAHDFILRGYKYGTALSAKELAIYGNDEVAKVFSECTRRELKREVAENISLTVVAPFAPFEVGGYTITPLPAVHCVEEQALLYLIEKDNKAYLHLNDTGRLTEETYAYLHKCGKKVDLVSMDCTLIDKGFSSSGRHMGVRENVAVRDRLIKVGVADENTVFVATHFSHNSNPISTRIAPILKEVGFIAAYDGMEIEI